MHSYRIDRIQLFCQTVSRSLFLGLNHLLYHTSGIADYVSMRPKKPERRLLVTPDILISRLVKAKEGLRFEPGDKEEYSNTNYVLLAEIITRVSAMSFADFMGKRVFKPLEMQDTAVVNKVHNTARFEDRAFGFRKGLIYFGKDIPYDLNHFHGVAGDGNIYATANDLVKWDSALRKGTFLPMDYYAQAYLPSKLNDGEVAKTRLFGADRQSGLGWGVEDLPVVYSYGKYRGFSNLYRRNLEEETVLIILSNSGFFLRTASIGDKLTKVIDDI